MDTLLQFGTVIGQRRIFAGNPELSPTGESQLHFRTQTVQSVEILAGTGSYFQPGSGAVRRGSRTLTGRWRVRGNGSLADIAAIKRSFDVMLSWGQQRLLKESGDGLQLWTWGIVEDVRVSENRSRLAYIWPTLSVTWRCESARWYGKETLTFFDGESTFADNLPLTPLKVENVAVSAGSSVPISNHGSERAGLYIELSVPAGVTVTNPQFQRRNSSGLVEDRLIYQDTLSGGDVLLFGEISQSLSGLSVNTVYDVFARQSNGSVMLELTAWTNDTTRATGLAWQDGIRVKAGAATRRYLGSVRTDASGQLNVNTSTVQVINENNRIATRAFDSLNDDEDYTGSYRLWTGGTTGDHVMVDVLMLPEISYGTQVFGTYRSSSGSSVRVGVGVDNLSNLASGLTQSTSVVSAHPGINLVGYTGYRNVRVLQQAAGTGGTFFEARIEIGIRF